jgi:hypothetical protein
MKSFWLLLHRLCLSWKSRKRTACACRSCAQVRDVLANRAQRLVGCHVEDISELLQVRLCGSSIVTQARYPSGKAQRRPYHRTLGDAGWHLHAVALEQSCNFGQDSVHLLRANPPQNVSTTSPSGRTAVALTTSAASALVRTSEASYTSFQFANLEISYHQLSQLVGFRIDSCY